MHEIQLSPQNLNFRRFADVFRRLLTSSEAFRRLMTSKDSRRYRKILKDFQTWISNCRIPRHFIYMCRCALKNEIYNNSCYSYSMRCKYAAGYSAIYNLGQNKWNIWTTPPPHFNDAKMARFALRASSSLLRGGGGLIVPFYTVQDCPRFLLA